MGHRMGDFRDFLEELDMISAICDVSWSVEAILMKCCFQMNRVEVGGDQVGWIPLVITWTAIIY